MKLIYQPPLIFCYKVYIEKDVYSPSLIDRFGLGGNCMLGHDTTQFRWLKGKDRNGYFVSFRVYDDAVEFMMWSG